MLFHNIILSYHTYKHIYLRTTAHSSKSMLDWLAFSTSNLTNWRYWTTAIRKYCNTTSSVLISAKMVSFKFFIN